MPRQARFCQEKPSNSANSIFRARYLLEQTPKLHGIAPLQACPLWLFCIFLPLLFHSNVLRVSEKLGRQVMIDIFLDSDFDVICP